MTDQEQAKSVYDQMQGKGGRECKDGQLWQQAFNVHKQLMKGQRGYCGTSVGCGGCRSCVWQWLGQYVRSL